jgi:hypothetical protein
VQTVRPVPSLDLSEPDRSELHLSVLDLSERKKLVRSDSH